MNRFIQNLTGLCALAALIPAAHGDAVSGGSPYVLQSAGTISVPVPTVVPTKGSDGDYDLTFQYFTTPVISFTGQPAGHVVASNFAPTKVLASDFNYAGNWQVDGSGLLTDYLLGDPNGYFQGHFDDTLTSDNQISTVTVYNNGTNADGDVKTGSPTMTSLTIPFTTIGTSASFTAQYFDPPSNTTLNVLLNNQTLLSGTFNQNGAFTQTGGSGTFTPNSSPAVPEPSALALLGLGVLPLIGIARRRSLQA